MENFALTQPDKTALVASISFCRAWQAYQKGDQPKYELLIEKSYNQIIGSSSAILNYWISTTFSSIAQSSSRHSESIEAMQNALSIAQNNNDQFRMATAFKVLALSEAALGYTEDALQLNQRAIDYHLSTDNKSQVLELYQNRGYILIGADKIEQASNIYQKAILLAQTIKNQYAIHSIYTNLSAIEHRKQNYEKAVAYAVETLNYANQNNFQELAAYARSLIAVSLAYKNNLETAEEYFSSANHYFHEHNKLDALSDNFDSWAEAMAQIGDYKRAYLAHVEYKKLSDKIFNSEREGKMLRLKTLYKLSEKDREIEALAERNRRNEIEIKNQQLQEKIWWLSSIIVLLLLSLFIFMYRKARAYSRKLVYENKELDRQRYIDPLTQIYNRRFFDQRVTEKIKQNSNLDYCIFILDIDHFKSINDTWGHSVGDMILVEFSNRINSIIRESDTLVRMGGEEFLLITESMGVEQDKVIARKILKTIADKIFEINSELISVTTSIGCIQLQKSRHSIQITETLELADQALYKAKKEGRNRAIYIQLLKSLEGLTNLESAIQMNQVATCSLRSKES
nr:diguanylate cyclase [Aliikangiella sp. G2MR2-5]